MHQSNIYSIQNVGRQKGIHIWFESKMKNANYISVSIYVYVEWLEVITCKSSTLI